MKHARLVAIVVALLVPSVLAQPASDAGTGLDAPNSESDVFFLTSGSYSGQLRKNDSDWYTSLDGAGSVACVTLAASADITADAKLVLRENGARRVMRTSIGPGADARLAQAASTLDDARIGFENSLDRSAYGFTLRTYSPSDFASDANTGADAPADPTAAPVVGAGCVGGRLGFLDTRDAYRFGGAAGDVAIFTFGAPSNLRLDIVGTDGALLASVLGGQRASLPLPTSGTYSMTAASSSATENVPYMVGLALGPPTQGCRPACLS